MVIKGGLIVLAIFGITAAVVPKYASADKAGRELTVKSFLRTVVVVNKSYRSRHRTYAENLDVLAREARIGAVVESTEKTSYVFSYFGGGHTWSCAADPALPGLAHFFVNESGVIRFRDEGAASSDDEEAK